MSAVKRGAPPLPSERLRGTPWPPAFLQVPVDALVLDDEAAHLARFLGEAVAALYARSRSRDEWDGREYRNAVYYALNEVHREVDPEKVRGHWVILVAIILAVTLHEERADPVIPERAAAIPTADPTAPPCPRCSAVGRLSVFHLDSDDPRRTAHPGADFPENEGDYRLLLAWQRAEMAQHAPNGWHFVRCPYCLGTGRIVAEGVTP